MTMTKRTITFEVTLPWPEDYSSLAMRHYVKLACAYWAGSGHPSDGLFGMDEKQVKVRRGK